MNWINGIVMLLVLAGPSPIHISIFVVVHNS